MTESQRNTRSKYRLKLNHFSIEFFPTDNDIWEHLQKQENKAGYIKWLIRQDLLEKSRD